MTISNLPGITAYIAIGICFLGASYSFGYEAGLKRECVRGGGVLIDMVCLDRAILLSVKNKSKESGNAN
tara:strand:+ start:137 stop:343 length:207 start_codon:yes stop_codon:yes gene_type:complete